MILNDLILEYLEKCLKISQPKAPQKRCICTSKPVQRCWDPFKYLATTVDNSITSKNLVAC